MIPPMDAGLRRALGGFSNARLVPWRVIVDPCCPQKRFRWQNAGDLIYVPANWKHMTLNIGESIGVGGQAVYGGEVRDCDDFVVYPPPLVLPEKYWGEEGEGEGGRGGGGRQPVVLVADGSVAARGSR